MGIYAKPVDKDGIVMYIENDNIFITGNIKVSNPSSIMEPFITEAHNSILENKVKMVKLDIRKLEYLNSSGIKEIVNWVTKLEKLSSNQKYHIIFLYNPEITWQETFVSSMVYLNTEFIKKETS
jgi:hypothetical protein